MKRLFVLLLALLMAAPEALPQRTGSRAGAGYNTKRKKELVTAAGSAEKAYYVSSSTGNDANDGLTPATAFASITKVNTLNLAGTINKVYFKKGDTFSGTITVGQSGTASKPVTFSAYGTGEKPKIYGSQLITGWTLHSGNIYKATFATTINQLFVDGERMLAAREPDSGFFTVDAAPTTAQITADELSGALNYTGTQCIIHSSSYGLETKAVTGSSSTTITLASAPFGDVTAGEKFILVGKLEFIDEAGEWFYDTATQTVYLWKPDGSAPTDTDVRGSVTDYGLTATSKSNFLVKDIVFAEQKTAGINITSSNNYTVNGVEVHYPDRTGIADLSSEDGQYLNNIIIGANHNGIASELSDSMLIQGNTVTNIALFDKLGLSGIGAWYNGVGISTNGDVNNILSNRVDEVGYDGISFHGLNTVRYNYVSNFCRTKNDGGGIYTSCPVTDPEYVYGSEMNKGSYVANNTILYGWGVNTNVTANANGIYLDESSGGVTVENNNIGYCTGWGIFWHKSNSHVTRNNILFANKTGFINTQNGAFGRFTQNYIYALSGQLLSQHVNSDPVVTTTVIDSNKYVAKYATLNFNVDWTGSKNFAYWKTNTGFDLHTTYDTTALESQIDEKFIVNATASPVTWYRNNSSGVVDAFSGDSMATTYVLPAYSSKVITGQNIGLFLPYVEDSVPPVPTITDGLIAVYEFEDSGTTLVDSHTNGLNGTNKSNTDADFSATPAAGNPGNAYSYIGTSFKYSTVPDATLFDFSGAFTVSAAVNVTSLSSSRGVFSKRNASYSEFEIYINTNGSVAFTLVENGNNLNRITCTTTATGLITTGTDNLIELRSDGTDRKAGFSLSVNKVNQALSYSYSGTVTSDLSTGIVHTTAPLMIGSSLLGAANLYGKISQIAIWNYSTPQSVSNEIYGDGNFKSYTNW